MIISFGLMVSCGEELHAAMHNIEKKIMVLPVVSPHYLIIVKFLLAPIGTISLYKEYIHHELCDVNYIENSLEER